MINKLIVLILVFAVLISVSGCTSPEADTSNSASVDISQTAQSEASETDGSAEEQSEEGISETSGFGQGIVLPDDEW